MRILMVCLGNICRSPLAHGIMAHLAKSENLQWEIDSAGTGDWHVGQAPDHRSVAIAKKYGVDISQQRAKHFTAQLFNKYDLIFVMDRQNLRDVLAQAKNDQDREKVRLFVDNDIVPDPYFDDALFLPVYEMVEKRCLELIKSISKS
ncbi:low molecular weight phosphotyrosine protein phosphatase [Sphingobacterium alkalisoli]|uniref:protein-tyrosine-phosphatase n=1 Tax=Sphingobacterium alkalisoli TaxID=1874115 RepID=A0A4U0H8S6_9SPHI|nr:low molecular weight protein-tyrosine-phosphatase [Sphingobacterium alkalisoli]TJY68275.1 low molecular weight phosphotyrosine protein phosphatase [Sphingobacterium alkalisoli]